MLWLDDLEPFLNQGVTAATLREWHAGGRPGRERIVVATYGGKGSDRITGATAAGLATTADEVFGEAATVTLTATTPEEEAALARLDGSGATDADRAAIRRSGLAAFLVAGPALERKLATGRHGAGQPPCPEGLAVVDAAVDWARCGRTDPIPDAVLRRLWSGYLPAGTPAADEAFTAAVTWARQPVAGTIALLVPTTGPGGHTAYDYVVRLRRQDPGARPVGDGVWNAAVTTADPVQADGVAEAAYYAGRLEYAADALVGVSAAADRQLAARAGNNLGVVLRDLGRDDEALAAYARVVTDHATDPSLAVREQVARALVGHGYQLGMLGRSEEAVAVYRRVVTGYATDPTPALREQVAKALYNQGVRLGVLGRSEEAVATYQRVVTGYATDPTTALREQVAKALYNQGVRLGVLGRSEEALATYRRVVTGYATDPTPALRELVASALVNEGVQLGVLGRAAEALAVYGRVVTDYAADADPALREHVAKALVNQGHQLWKLRRSAEALAAYRRVVTGYGADAEPAIQDVVRRARVGLTRGDAEPNRAG